MSLDTFEQSLLTELRQHVSAAAPSAAPPRRRRALVLAGGALAAAGSAAAVVVLGLGPAGPAGAYAVEEQPNGDVAVTVHDLSDATGLEHALDARGIHAVVSYAPGFVQSDGQRRAGTPGSRADCAIALAKVDGGLRFTLGAAQIARGAELDIVTSGSSPAEVGSPVSVSWSGGGC